MRLECPNKSPEDNVRPNLLEDHYNTIDDVTHALSDYDLEMDVVIHKQTSHEIRRNNEHIHYDYAYSRGICPMEAALTHVADDTLLTARSNSARPVGIFQVEGNEVPDTDHVYITVLDDSSPSVELSQVEKLT
ncbi:hypothetical protein ACJMK2_026105 [Sinanodonta woodiana]|uniref:Uncharacterized protein n=1 Tax=Sinanodonta woodiana TaxID=1069815 RepID=A0ABD3XIJ0_SINWO